MGPRELVAVQNKRRTRKLSNRTINHELGTLRQILKSRGFWGPISDQVRMLRERHDIGRAISRTDEDKLLVAVRESLSPSLSPRVRIPSARRHAYQCVEKVFGSIGVPSRVVNTGIVGSTRSGCSSRSSLTTSSVS